jgi:iron complex transport system ATP-binding protein
MNLEVQNICWSVDDRKIIDRVLLDVRPGEFVGLLGPNGSGKSTLLRTIYRVLKPDAGLVALDGDNVWKLSPREAAQRTAVVAQERSSDFDFTVFEMVMLGRNPHKKLFDQDSREDFQLVESALRQVNMLHFAKRDFRTLSGGEKQRVLVARALAQQASFLVLDEPTNHLDIRYQLEILALVKGLKTTTLAALHDLNLAAQYCDRIFMLQDGRVIASGVPEVVLQPEIIRTVYQVDAYVERHVRTNQLQVTFFPLTPVAQMDTTTPR